MVSLHPNHTGPAATSPTPRRGRTDLARPRPALLAATLLLVALWTVSKFSTPSSGRGCLLSIGRYAGPIHAKYPETVRSTCLVESPWLLVARRSVRMSVKGKMVKDWLWIDYHDRINVLVEAPSRPDDAAGPAAATSSREASFVILEQTKYALDGASLAVVGGIIEPDEGPLAAAIREVEEELAITCRSWKALGRFRTDVNRGMGWVHPYVARDCGYTSNSGYDASAGERDAGDEVGGRDAEEQLLSTMTLSEVKEAVLGGRFVEVQWSNTVALAMLHYSSQGD